MKFIPLLALFSLAWVQALPPGSVTVQGIATDARNGDPLPSVQIQLTGTVFGESRERTFTAFTARDGKFLFAVPPAEYSLVAQRPGYFGPSRGAVPQQNVTRRLRLVEGQALPEQKFSLTPGGVVTGRIVDEVGRPAGGLTVALRQMRYGSEGNPEISQARNAVTNELGEYRIYWAPPGDYMVTVEPLSTLVAAPTSGSSNTMVRTFYPGTTLIDSARTVTVASGSEVKAIDFGFKTVATFKVSGRVVNPYVPPGGPPPETSALPGFTLIYRDSPYAQEMNISSLANAVTPADRRAGLFELQGIPAGRYDLFAQIRSSVLSSVSYSGSVSIDLNAQDLKNIEISLRPPVELRGRIVTSGNVRLDEYAGVSLVYRGSFRVGGIQQGTIDASGAFTVKGLVAGVHRILVSPPAGAFVADIRQGNRSIYSDGLIRVGGEAPEPVEIVIAPGIGSVSGAVVHPDGKKGTDTMVVLVPEGSLRANSSLHRGVPPEESGQFTINNVTPGRYKLFAWESMPGNAWRNAQFLAKYEDLGVAVTVTAGQASGLRVPVTWLSPRSPE